jgi:hypothetical protein
VHRYRHVGQGSIREAVRRLHEKLLGGVGSAMVFVFDHMQGGKRELLRQTPGHAERCGDVEAATHEHRRNASDASGAPADAIGGQERVVAEEVGHQAGEAEPEGGVGVAGVRLGRPVQGREPFLPRAPGSGGAIS